MPTKQYTPTSIKPWKVIEIDDKDSLYKVTCLHDEVADFYTLADAELAVRAVNAHDELVAALKEMLDTTIDEVGTLSQEAIKRMKAERRTRAKAAIAKAEGRT